MKRLYLLTIICSILLSQSLKASGVKMEQVEVPEHIKEKFKNAMLSSTAGSEYLIVLPPNDTDAPGYTSATAIYVGTLEEQATITLSFSATGEVISTKTILPYTVISFVSASEPGEKVLDPNAWAIRTTDRQISDKAMYVKSENGVPITVYVGSFRSATAEGYMALPISSLGKRYIHCSYNDNYESASYPFHTGFICAAPYDDTRVTVNLKGRKSTFCVTDDSERGIGQVLTSPRLSAGDAWNVWNKFKPNHPRGECDFTGSVISSTQPIAVYSYHERTDLPTDVGNRDNLVEQLLPTNLWGKEHISLQLRSTSATYAIDLDPVRGGGDYFRVVASDPNTNLQAVWYDLKTGELRGQAFGLLEEEGSMWHYRENQSTPRKADGVTSITGVCVFKSDKPVQVMQYAYSTGYFVSSGDSDPLMVIVPPLEQLGHETIFQTAGYSAFNVHAYNLIAKGDSKDPIKNRQLLETVTYKESSSNPRPIEVLDESFYTNNVPGTDYYYAMLKLAGGKPYVMKGHTSIGGYLYGFGSVISYGWLSSMSLIEPGDLDTLAPEVSHTLFCNRPDRETMPGRVIFKSTFADTTNQLPASEFDDGQVDKGLSQAPALISPENVKIFRYFYEDPPKSATDKWNAPEPIKKGGVEFEVEDIYKDAYTVVRYTDRAGNTTLDTMVYIADKIEWLDNGTVITSIDFGDLITGSSYKKIITIKNIADKEIKLDSLILGKSTVFQITEIVGMTLPALLGPGQQCDVEITFTPEGGPAADKLTLYTECLYFNISVTGGSGIPKIRVTDKDFGQVLVETCSPNGTITITNTGNKDLVITGFTFDPPLPSSGDTIFKYIPTPSTDVPPWTITAGNSKEIRYIRFCPKEIGDTTVRIIFESNAADVSLDPDRKDYGVLTGEGNKSDPDLSSYDWGKRRVLTVNDAAVQLTNSGNMPIIIKNIVADGWTTEASSGDLVSPEGSYRVVGASKFAGTVVEANKANTIDIPVRFVPQSEYVNIGSSPISVKFYVNFESSAGIADNTVSSTLAGMGILPKISATGFEFPNTPMGEECEIKGNITIRNTSRSAPLFIKSIKYATGAYQTGDFHPEPAFVAVDIDQYISPEDSLVYPVSFIPESTSPPNRLAVVNIENDAATGPEVNPIIVSQVELIGRASDGGIDVTAIDFGTVTRCTDTVGTFLVVNESTTTELLIDSILIDPAYANIFNLVGEYKNIVVPPSSNIKVNVRFIASQYPTQGVISANAFVYTDYIDTVTVIKANPLIIPVELTMDSFGLTDILVPGRDLDFPIHIKMGAGNAFFTYENAKISHYKVEIKFDPTTIDIKNVIGNSVTVTPNYKTGTAVIEGNGNGNVIVTSDGVLFTLQLLLLKGEASSTDVTFNSISFEDRNACISSTNSGGVIKTTVCGNDLRDVVIGESKFFVEPITPNPYTGKDLTISYSLGFDVDTKIEIYNSVGELVKEVVNANMKGGKHDVNVNISDFATGSYIINMKSGPYEYQQPLVIVK